jgi:hypothetical protein
MTTKKQAPKRLKKRPYRTPKLITHGDLRTMTMAKGGALGDGGSNPKTRVTSGPG